MPVRIYLPREKVTEDLPVFLFLFHGGYWVTDCIDNYEKNLCKTGIRDRTYCGVGRIQTGARNIHFNKVLVDCYAVAKAIYTNRFILNVNPQRITLIGDSAGGNLAVSSFTESKR